MRFLPLLSLMLVAFIACGATTYYREASPETDSLQVWFCRAAACYGSGDATGAINWFAHVAEIDPLFPGVLYNLGMAHSLAGDTLNAGACFRRQLDMQPEDDASWRALGHIAMQGRRPHDALMCYRNALLLAPDEPAGLLGAGRAAYLTGDIAQALEYLEHGHAIDAEDADIACSLGLLYRETGREEEGRVLLELAARLGSREAFEFLRQ
ncbi:MAG: tetratricopeptide repeat protein [Candidatus Cloacimonetes bacterium]|nr:tetratricopeptide repeat protein [Candidatus Cloacimonadota bacterium]